MQLNESAANGFGYPIFVVWNKTTLKLLTVTNQIILQFFPIKTVRMPPTADTNVEIENNWTIKNSVLY